jgi:hypothetical protein
MDAVASGDQFTGRNVRSGRRSRVVLAPRPWRYVGGSFPAGNEGKKGRFPGESTKEAVKPLRGESRDVLAVPVVLTRVLSFAHGATGAVGARLSLRPLQERGTTKCHNPGENLPRECTRAPSRALTVCSNSENLPTLVGSDFQDALSVPESRSLPEAARLLLPDNMRARGRTHDPRVS